MELYKLQSEFENYKKMNKNQNEPKETPRYAPKESLQGGKFSKRFYNYNQNLIFTLKLLKKIFILT